MRQTKVEIQFCHALFALNQNGCTCARVYVCVYRHVQCVCMCVCMLVYVYCVSDGRCFYALNFAPEYILYSLRRRSRAV